MPVQNSSTTSAPLITQALANPAAGSSFTLTVPAGVWWRVISGHATLQAQAVAGTGRKLIMRAGGPGAIIGTNEYWASLCETGANINGDGVNTCLAEVLYTGAKNPTAPWFGQAQNFGSIKVFALTIPFLDIWLPPGWVWDAPISNIMAGDAVTNVQFLIEQMSGAPASGGVPYLP